MRHHLQTVCVKRQLGFNFYVSQNIGLISHPFNSITCWRVSLLLFDDNVVNALVICNHAPPPPIKRGWVGNSGQKKEPGFYCQLAPTVPGECVGFVFTPEWPVVCPCSAMSYSRDFTICSSQQCRAFGRDLLGGKLKVPGYSLGGGAWLQMTSA